MKNHFCRTISRFPLDKFHQRGIGRGKYVLLVGESPAPNGWRKSGKACYTSEGKIVPTGKRLNELLADFDLSVGICGFTELSKCYVGKNRKLLTSCSAKCWPIFLKQIEGARYKLLILLGVETTRIFVMNSGIALFMGIVQKISLDSKPYWILPIYHPSPINPTGRLKNQKIFKNSKKKIEKIIRQ